VVKPKLPPSPPPQNISDGLIGDGLKQGTMGDCFAITSIYGVGHTDTGREAIKHAIKDNGDGTYSVTFAGDAAHKPYTVTQDDLKKGYADGDVDANILGAAMDKYINDPANIEEAKKHFGHGRQAPGATDEGPLTIGSGGDATYIMNLLAGGEAKSFQLSRGQNNKDTIKDYLVNQASRVGKSSVITFGATVDPATGDVASPLAQKGGHSFAVQKIDLNNDAANGGTVYYVNPWDTSKVRSISVNELSKDLADSTSTEGSTLESISFSG